LANTEEIEGELADSFTASAKGSEEERKANLREILANSSSNNPSPITTEEAKAGHTMTAAEAESLK